LVGWHVGRPLEVVSVRPPEAFFFLNFSALFYFPSPRPLFLSLPTPFCLHPRSAFSSLFHHRTFFVAMLNNFSPPPEQMFRAPPAVSPPFVICPPAARPVLPFACASVVLFTCSSIPFSICFPFHPLSDVLGHLFLLPFFSLWVFSPCSQGILGFIPCSFFSSTSYGMVLPAFCIRTQASFVSQFSASRLPFFPLLFKYLFLVRTPRILCPSLQ